MRGMERSLQSTFPRIQVALRRSMHDFQVSRFRLSFFVSEVLTINLGPNAFIF